VPIVAIAFESHWARLPLLLASPALDHPEAHPREGCQPAAEAPPLDGTSEQRKSNPLAPSTSMEYLYDISRDFSCSQVHIFLARHHARPPIHRTPSAGAQGSAVWSLDVVFAVAGDERAGAAEGDAALWCVAIPWATVSGAGYTRLPTGQARVCDFFMLPFEKFPMKDRGITFSYTPYDMCPKRK